MSNFSPKHMYQAYKVTAARKRWIISYDVVTLGGNQALIIKLSESRQGSNRWINSFGDPGLGSSRVSCGANWIIIYVGSSHWFLGAGSDRVLNTQWYCDWDVWILIVCILTGGFQRSGTGYFEITEAWSYRGELYSIRSGRERVWS